LRPILDTTSLSPFYGSVALAVWFGGLGPGLVALGLAMGAGAIVLWHPIFDLGSTGGHDLTRWLIFTCLGGLVVVLGTELHRRQDMLEEVGDELHAVQGITEVFARAKSPSEIADAVLTRGLQVIEAGSGAVYVFDDEQEELALERAVGYPPELTEMLRRVPLDAPLPVAAATRTREAVFLGSPAEMEEQFGDAAAEGYLPVGRALSAVPLFHRSRPVGAVVFAFREEQDFSDDQISSILALAALCEEAMARAKEQQTEHGISMTLQRSMLPLSLPDFPGLEVAADYLPGAVEADVGGDWYDGVVLDDGRVVLTVGDIAGRGVHAAALMSRLRIALKCYAVDGSSPAEALARLDVFIAHLPEDYFATVVMIRVDPETGEVEYACAGHPPPVLVRAGGTVSLLEEGRSGPIDVGVQPSERADASVRLAPGDALLLYTDGLIEQREKPISEGMQVLLDALTRVDGSSARVLVNLVVSRLRAEHELEDDVALLAVRFVQPTRNGRNV
jgi:serine phosphatase RsbU (regulator of sigma subunit)